MISVRHTVVLAATLAVTIVSVTAERNNSPTG